MTTTAMRSTATTPSQAEPFMLEQRIGSTVYTVSVRFSRDSKETAQDKLLRLMESEVCNIA